jgi:hypothetical protein
MAAKITGAIPVQNFESIRDTIASILVLELAAQTLTTSLKVWKERIIPFDVSELPAVNVYFDTAPYDNHNAKNRRAVNHYIIDVHVNAKHTTGSDGDTLASVNAQRYAGIIMYILSSAEYYTLGYQPGIIANRRVESVTIGRIQQNDAMHTVIAQIQFSVTANETVGDLTGMALTYAQTCIKIDTTEKGILIELKEETP